MWNEGMISLTLPGDPLLLPVLFSGAARGSPGHPSPRVGRHCHSEGRRGAAEPAAADLLWGPDPPANPEAALGRLHAGSRQPLLPALLSSGAYGENEDLSRGLSGGRDAPAGPQCRRARDGGLLSPLTPLFFDPPAPP